MKWQRVKYQPNTPLGANGQKLTASKAHTELSKQAAKEGMVLLKNENSLLPFEKGTRLAVFGKASADYVKGGGGSGDAGAARPRAREWPRPAWGRRAGWGGWGLASGA